MRINNTLFFTSQIEQRHTIQKFNIDNLSKSIHTNSFNGHKLVDDSFEYQPEKTQTLSNKNGYKVFIDGAGAGTTINPDNIAIVRGNNDPLRAKLGSFFYLREGKNFWSAGLQPTLAKPDSYVTEFSDKKAKITRQDGPIKSELEVVVAPDDNVEERRITLYSTDDKPHDIEITSYNETALAVSEGHPAFSKLFVETKYNPLINGIIASRRPRGPHDKIIMVANTIRVNKEDMAKDSKIEYETVREKFIGRDDRELRDLKDPVAMHKKHLSNSTGITLDSISSLRTKVHIEPGKKVQVDFATISAQNENELLELAKKYADSKAVDKILNQ